MAISFLSGINLNQNQLIGARIENLTGDPASGVVGQIIFNTTSLILKVCTVAGTTTAVYSPIGSAGSTYTLPVSVGAANTAVMSLTDSSNVVTSTVTFSGTTNQIAVSETVGNNGTVRIELAPAITIAGPITLTGAGQSSFAGQVTIPTTPVAATDAASKGYVDSVVTGGVVWQGGYNATTGLPNLVTPAPGVVKKGYMWTVTTEGLAFYSEQLRVGDSLIANVLNPSVVTDWTRVQSNIDIATDNVFGLVKLGAAGAAGGSAAALGTATARTYSVQFNGNSQLVVNVPWTDTIGRVEQATTTNSGGSAAFLGIDIPNPASGTVVVGLSINGLIDITTATVGADYLPIYDASVPQNKKVSVTNLALTTNALTTAAIVGPATAGTSFTITIGTTTGTTTWGADSSAILVQLVSVTSGETIFADITRGAAGLITISFGASQAINTIRALLQKIG